MRLARSNRRGLRAASPLLAVVGVLVSLAGVARAEWEDPTYGREDLALADESLPAGWKVVPEADPARVGGEAVVRAVVDEAATEAALPKAERESLPQAFRAPDGAVVTAVLVDVYQDPAKFRAALAPRAEKAALVVKEMASPARILVVSGPPARRDEVAAFHVKGSARLLAKRALVAVTEEGLPEHGTNLAAASLALEPGLALARLARGLVWATEARDDAAARGKAIAEIEAALAPGNPTPVEATARALGSGMMGSLLLVQKTREADEKGRDALAAAVSAPGDLSKQRVAQFRYDLACAHARLGAKDAAFEHLKAVLEADRASTIVGIGHWREDPDFAALKADPRWQGLLDEHGKSDETARE
jgi:hypothetical protein